MSDREAVRYSARIWGTVVCATRGRNEIALVVKASVATLHPLIVRILREGRTFAGAWFLTPDGNKSRSCAAEGIIRDYRAITNVARRNNGTLYIYLIS